MFTLTLPIPIVVNRYQAVIISFTGNQTFICSFAGFYKNRLWRNEVAHKKRVRLEEKAAAKKEDEEIILTPESRQTLIKATGGWKILKVFPMNYYSGLCNR